MNTTFVLFRSAKGMIDIFDEVNKNILAASDNPRLILGIAQDYLRTEGKIDTGGWDYGVLVFNNDSGKMVKIVKIQRTTTIEALLTL